MIQAGTPQRDIALRFGVHRNTISSLWRRLQTTGSGSDRPRSGRPRVKSERQDQYIRVTHLRNHSQTAGVTARTIPGLLRIHPRTVRNRLREQHIRPRRPCVRTLLLPRHRAERLRWSRAHLRWRLREWEAVLFSDESRFSLDHSDGRIKVYRRVGERYQDACIRQRRVFGGGSVMAWGGISAHDRTPLVIINDNLNAHRYPEEVVRPHALPFVRSQRKNMSFLQDNARPHVVRLIMNFLRHENVLVMNWPSMSPRRNGQTVETTTKPACHAVRSWRSPARNLARNLTSIPCQPSGINEASVSGMFQCARWSHTLLTVWTVVWRPLCCDVIENDIIDVESLLTSWAQA